MTRRFKYVILDNTFPRISGGYDKHADLASGGSLGSPTSAGFAQLSVEGGHIDLQCWGESVGLKLKADPVNDARLLLSLFQDPI